MDLTDEHVVIATTPSGHAVVLEVAQSPQKRARGLMFRAEVPFGTGMLFVMQEAGLHPFWMFQCEIALDIAWLDAQGVVVDIATDVPPCKAPPCPSYAPKRAATLVVEVAAGDAARLGIVPGARLLIDPRSARTGSR